MEMIQCCAGFPHSFFACRRGCTCGVEPEFCMEKRKAFTLRLGIYDWTVEVYR